MKQVFTDASSDLLNTTHQAKTTEKIAFDLGRDDGEALASAGLIAKSNAAASSVYQTHQRKEKNRAALTALELAMQNQEYRQRYQAVWHKLDDIQAVLDEAILENAEHIEALESNAVQTADGRMLFQSENGFVYADGTIVAQKDEPSPSDILKDVAQWADYKSAIDRRRQLARIQTDTLDTIRTLMSDPDNPPDQPALDDFDRRLDEVSSILEGPDLTAESEFEAKIDGPVLTPLSLPALDL